MDRFVLFKSDMVSDDDYIISTYARGVIAVNRNYEFIRYNQNKQKWVKAKPYYVYKSDGSRRTPSIHAIIDGKQVWFSVPRIIVDVFKGGLKNPNERITHIDRNPWNNYPTNLRVGKIA